MASRSALACSCRSLAVTQVARRVAGVHREVRDARQHEDHHADEDPVLEDDPRRPGDPRQWMRQLVQDQDRDRRPDGQREHRNQAVARHMGKHEDDRDDRQQRRRRTDARDQHGTEQTKDREADRERDPGLARVPDRMRCTATMTPIANTHVAPVETARAGDPKMTADAPSRAPATALRTNRAGKKRPSRSRSSTLGRASAVRSFGTRRCQPGTAAFICMSP